MRGQVVVVTGAARGLGAELARQLTARGARLALLGLEPGVLAEVEQQCAGSRAWTVDVTDGEALARVADEVVAHFGRVDLVVANAGLGAGCTLLGADPAAYDRVLEVNLMGSVRTVRAFLPHLVASRGHVLQVASLAALLPVPLMTAYCTSKSAVEAFAHALRTEVRHHGVTVGVAYLSWTDTDMVRGADATPGLGDFRARLPGVFGRTYPMVPAVERMVDGLARRRAHVYAQPWLRLLRPLSGLTPGVVALAVRRDVPLAEAALADAGPAATRPVGAGGVADSTGGARRPSWD